MVTKREKNAIIERYTALKPFLKDKQQRRKYAAAEARVIRHGGISILIRITGINRESISTGINEIENWVIVDKTSVRTTGGRRKKLEEIDSEIINEIEKIMESSTCGSS